MITKASPILRTQINKASSAASVRWKRRQLVAACGFLWFSRQLFSTISSNSSGAFGVAISSLLLLQNNTSSISNSSSSSSIHDTAAVDILNVDILSAPDISLRRQQDTTKSKRTDADKNVVSDENEERGDKSSIISTLIQQQQRRHDDVIGNSESSLVTANDNNSNNISRQPLADTRLPLIKTISTVTTTLADVKVSWSSSNNQQPVSDSTQHGTDLLSNITNNEHSPTTWSIGNDNNRNDVEAAPSTTSFYRWESANGIQMEPLWHYIKSLALPNAPRDPYGPFPGFIDNQATLKTSIRVYRRRCQTIFERAIFVGPFFQDALYHFYHRSSALVYNKTRVMFPYLSRALQDGGLPFVFSLQDHYGCCYQNYNYTPVGENISISANLPMLTLSYSPHCNYAFPIPSYTTVRLAKRHPDEWNTAFNQSDTLYPWNTKIKKAVWRGSISGGGQFKQSLLDIQRLHINYLAKLHPDILDVAVPCSAKSKCGDIRQSWKQYLVLGDSMPFAEFQKYRAVLDLDGNSWSERFPRLLCQNSVVIKLDPEQIDYFWPTLRAGVHYVAANITNLVSVVQHVTSDAHQAEMQAIVANAHEWCQHHMVQWDILSLLNSYAQELYKGDPLWHRHITQLYTLKLLPPRKWQHHPVSAWNATF